MSEKTTSTVNTLTVAEIKAELSTRNLSTRGKKDELMTRLLEATNGLSSMTETGETCNFEASKTQSENEAVDIIVAQMEKEACTYSSQGVPSYKLNRTYSKPTSKSDSRGETLQKNIPDVLNVAKVEKELRPLCSALESVAKSLEHANQLLHQERAYSKGLLQENLELKLKLKDMEGKNSGLVDNQISHDTRKKAFQDPSQNSINAKTKDNGYEWQVVRPRRTTLSMEQKSWTERANRKVAPGEETYSEALQNKQPERRNTVDNSLFLSTKEYPALMNSFGTLETKQLNENERKHEENNRARSTAAQKRPTTTEILGDSIVKGIQGHKMKEAINHCENVFVRSFAGANTDAMNSYVCPTIKKAPNRIILHCGTNDLRSKESPWIIAENIIELAKQMESRETEVIVSGIVQRADELNGKALEVNRALERECDRMKLKYIDNSNIDPKLHLNRSGLHLNYAGTVILANNFIREMGY